MDDSRSDRSFTSDLPLITESGLLLVTANDAVSVSVATKPDDRLRVGRSDVVDVYANLRCGLDGTWELGYLTAARCKRGGARTRLPDTVRSRLEETIVAAVGQWARDRRDVLAVADRLALAERLAKLRADRAETVRLLGRIDHEIASLSALDTLNPGRL